MVVVRIRNTNQIANAFRRTIFVCVLNSKRTGRKTIGMNESSKTVLDIMRIAQTIANRINNFYSFHSRTLARWKMWKGLRSIKNVCFELCAIFLFALCVLFSVKTLMKFATSTTATATQKRCNISLLEYSKTEYFRNYLHFHCACHWMERDKLRINIRYDLYCVWSEIFMCFEWIYLRFEENYEEKPCEPLNVSIRHSTQKKKSRNDHAFGESKIGKFQAAVERRHFIVID